MPAKKPAARKPAAKKPQDLRDITNFIEKVVSGGKPAKRGANMVVSAQLQNISSAKKKTVSKASKAGHKGMRTVESAGKFAFGDPKKGWKDVAINTGGWILPYGKGAKAINVGTKFIKGAKTAKVVRGTLKTAGYLGASEAYGKAVNSVGKKSSPKSKTTSRVKKNSRVRGK